MLRCCVRQPTGGSLSQNLGSQAFCSQWKNSSVESVLCSQTDSQGCLYFKIHTLLCDIPYHSLDFMATFHLLVNTNGNAGTLIVKVSRCPFSNFSPISSSKGPSLYRSATRLSTMVISMIARFFPGHMYFPFVNGRNGTLSGVIVSQRSGKNSSGLFQYFGSRWIAYVGTLTLMPPGMNISSICSPPGGVARGIPPGTEGLSRRVS